MPATIVIVHDDRNVLTAALLTIRAAGHDVAAFSDPMTALNAIEKDSRVRVLVSQIDFGTGKLNGVALSQMLRVKQITQDGKSSLRPIFLDRPEHGHHASGVGEFVPTPLNAQTLVVMIGSVLSDE
jgi:DNA-binding NtrC family response regulator